MAIKKLGLSFYINTPTQFKGTPSLKTIANTFDYIGDIVSLDRLHGESNVDYKNRQFDANVHKGSPTYFGVINNVNRDFGFLRQPAMTVDLKLDSSGEPVATSPKLEILANKVVLYSDWRPDGTEVIDREIRTYQSDDEGYFLVDLVTKINESEYFEATLSSNIRENILSSFLVRGESILEATDQIKVDKTTILRYRNIVPNSFYFYDADIFKTEVYSAPSSSGEYYIDYLNGIITTYDLPSEPSACSFYVRGFPYIPDYIPIQIFTLQDDNFQEELFNKKTLPSGEETNSILNAEGSEIYHQLFKETEVFWGK